MVGGGYQAANGATDAQRAAVQLLPSVERAVNIRWYIVRWSCRVRHLRPANGLHRGNAVAKANGVAVVGVRCVAARLRSRHGRCPAEARALQHAMSLPVRPRQASVPPPIVTSSCSRADNVAQP